VQNNEAKSDPSEGEDVGSGDKDQVQRGVLDLGGHILTFDLIAKHYIKHFTRSIDSNLLEVELRVDMEPISDLNDVEELEHEGHVGVRDIPPRACEC
jgi:hypothetical protein